MDATDSYHIGKSRPTTKYVAKLLKACTVKRAHSCKSLTTILDASELTELTSWSAQDLARVPTFIQLRSSGGECYHLCPFFCPAAKFSQVSRGEGR